MAKEKLYRFDIATKLDFPFDSSNSTVPKIAPLRYPCPRLGCRHVNTPLPVKGTYACSKCGLGTYTVTQRHVLDYHIVLDRINKEQREAVAAQRLAEQKVLEKKRAEAEKARQEEERREKEAASRELKKVKRARRMGCVLLAPPPELFRSCPGSPASVYSQDSWRSSSGDLSPVLSSKPLPKEPTQQVNPPSPSSKRSQSSSDDMGRIRLSPELCARIHSRHTYAPPPPSSKFLPLDLPLPPVSIPRRQPDSPGSDDNVHSHPSVAF